MELEVKKNEKGDLICEMKEGINAGTKVNINELMRWIGEDLMYLTIEKGPIHGYV